VAVSSPLGRRSRIVALLAAAAAIAGFALNDALYQIISSAYPR
jgi:hypothetical protein